LLADLTESGTINDEDAEVLALDPVLLSLPEDEPEAPERPEEAVPGDEALAALIAEIEKRFGVKPIVIPAQTSQVSSKKRKNTNKER